MSSNPLDDLAAVRRERVAAMVGGDVATLDRITADDFTMVHALNAVTDTKATLLDRGSGRAHSYTAAWTALRKTFEFTATAR